MTCSKDFDSWLSEFGPKDTAELASLKNVVLGEPFASPYSGFVPRGGDGWFIRRDKNQPLNLSSDSARKGFLQLLWYYQTGRKPFHRHRRPPTLEAFFED